MSFPEGAVSSDSGGVGQGYHYGGPWGKKKITPREKKTLWGEWASFKKDLLECVPKGGKGDQVREEL